jgi:hypothetical protein
MSTADTLRFQCSECGYKARIPRRYEGKSIKCPSCTSSQIAQENTEDSIGDTVAVKQVQESTSKTDGKFRFNCGECGYRARIPVKYVGMAIKCPGYGATQMAQQGDDEETAGSSGKTAAIRSLQSAENDAFTFDCPSCHYRAKVPGKYLGKSIKCPQCASTFTAEPSSQATSTGNTVAINSIDPGTKPQVNKTLAQKPIAPVDAQPGTEEPKNQSPMIQSTDEQAHAPTSAADGIAESQPATESPAQEAPLEKVSKSPTQADDHLASEPIANDSEAGKASQAEDEPTSQDTQFDTSATATTANGPSNEDNQAVTSTPTDLDALAPEAPESSDNTETDSVKKEPFTAAGSSERPNQGAGPRTGSHFGSKRAAEVVADIAPRRKGAGLITALLVILVLAGAGASAWLFMQLDETNKSLEASQTSLSQAQNKLTTAEQALATATTDLEETQKTLTARETELTAAQTTIGEQLAAIAGLEAEQMKQAAVLESTTTKLEEAQQQTEASQTQLQAVTEQYEASQRTIEVLTTEIAALKAAASAQPAAIVPAAAEEEAAAKTEEAQTTKDDNAAAPTPAAATTPAAAPAPTSDAEQPTQLPQSESVVE